MGYDLTSFIKIFPVTPRVKDTNSFIDKALYRAKTYSNPICDITDKVGVRFVVLNLDEIDIIKNIIDSTIEWEVSKDRDFENERDDKPELFTYQSVHYVVKNRKAFTIDDIAVNINTPCEIQIRTLLQHAYAELSHDIAYKKAEDISSQMKRKFARSMALIEATDELFKEVCDMVNTEEASFKEYLSTMKPFAISDDYVENLNKFIFSAYKPLMQRYNISAIDIKEFIFEKHFLQGKVKKQDGNPLLRRQPITYLVYYLISKYKHQVIESWPLTQMELQPLFNDMGVGFELH